MLQLMFPAATRAQPMSRSRASHKNKEASRIMAATKKSSSSHRGTARKKSSSSRKYSKKAQTKVGKVMREYKQGKLKSGGRSKVKSRKQAIAIGISEARRSGAKVPRKKKAA
jgi:hypothetical protein